MPHHVQHERQDQCVIRISLWGCKNRREKSLSCHSLSLFKHGNFFEFMGKNLTMNDENTFDFGKHACKITNIEPNAICT